MSEGCEFNPRGGQCILFSDDDDYYYYCYYIFFFVKCQKMWTRVITLCCLLLPVTNTNANSDSEDEDGVSEYDINNFHDAEITGNKE